MASFEHDILILCKTYPSPSGKYIETSCVAGMDPIGRLIRLFPVPFRLIDGAQQFKKWQWVSARIDRAVGDRRPESHKLFVDTIRFNGEPLSIAKSWQARRRNYYGKLKVFSDFAALDTDRLVNGTTLGVVRPKRILGLNVPTLKPDWTDRGQNCCKASAREDCSTTQTRKCSQRFASFRMISTTATNAVVTLAFESTSIR